MASVQNHGGGCCGVRHVYGMDNTTVADVERLITQVDGMPNVGGADSGRLIEVILSQRQVGMDGRHGDRWADCVRAEGGWPAVMQRLGFRLVSRFNNANSGYDCFVFHRVPHFKSLQDLPFAWDFDGFRTPRPGGPGRLTPAEATTWRVNDRIRYNGANRHAGAHGVIVRDRGQAAGNNRYDVRFDNGDVVTSYTSTNFVRVNIDDRPLVAPAPPAPVAAPVVVVATFYANVLQTGIGAFFPTVEAARAAAPRCRQQARIEISSDGTRRTVNL